MCKKILFLFFLFITIFLLRSYAETDPLCEKCSQQDVAPEEENNDIYRAWRGLINEKIKIIKEDPILFDGIIFRIAVPRKEDSLCEQAIFPEKCKDLYQDVVDIVLLISGECGNVENKEVRNICSSIEHKNPKGLKGWGKYTYYAMTKGEAESLKRAIEEYVKEGGFIPGSVDEVKFFLGERMFKNSSKEKEAQEYSEEFVKRFPLTVYISGLGSIPDNIKEEDVNDVINNKIDKFIEDIATLLVSKENKSADLCNKIVSEYIRSACLDPNVNAVEDLIDFSTFYPSFKQ